MSVSTHTNTPKPLRGNIELKWQAEAQQFITEDLQRYDGLPKGDREWYIKTKATEDAIRKMKEFRRPITKEELHCILQDHVKRAVPNERYRRYSAC